MPNDKRLKPLTDAEEARIQQGIASDPDNPELSDEELANLKPASEVLPKAMYEALSKKGRGPQRRPTKQLLSVRLDREVIERYRATGEGWQARMNADLRKAVGL